MDETTEAEVLHMMFMMLVHQMPDRIVTIAQARVTGEKLADEEVDDIYPDHEIRFRIRDDVIESFCWTCNPMEPNKDSL